jgi:DNA-binding CsgD family transcriptional regulator
MEQKHPWGLASAKRCAACIDLSGRYDDEAATEMSNAAGDYESLGMHFDQGRTLLFLGGLQRGFNKRSGARQSLHEAAELFDRCGATGWAIRARAELARVSGRRSTAETELTPSERQVVELAVLGLSNKEIASQLVVSVYTVEAHLSHAYAKLGVRSRAQLARALGDTSRPV